MTRGFWGRNFRWPRPKCWRATALTPLLCDRDTPTPVIAHTIRARKALGGINMTASHNPAEYQGLKFSTSNGAPATPEVTKQIEANIAQLASRKIGAFNGLGDWHVQCKTIDPQPDYFKQMRKLIDFADHQKSQAEGRRGTHVWHRPRLPG